MPEFCCRILIENFPAGLVSFIALALPPGELSAKPTERALKLSLSGLALLGHLSQGERQDVRTVGDAIPTCLPRD